MSVTQSTINLSKGGRVNLTKQAPSVSRFRVGLGWKANQTNTGADFDLDVSLFGLKYVGDDPKLLDTRHFVFYNSENRTEDGNVLINVPADQFPKRGMPCTPCLGLIHSGDNQTGNADGDDESVVFDTSKISSEIDEVSIVVTIHDADVRKQSFGQVTKAYIRIMPEGSTDEVAHYDLEEDFSSETAVQVGSFYRKNGEWSFKAVGSGYNVGLQQFLDNYSA